MGTHSQYTWEDSHIGTLGCGDSESDFEANPKLNPTKAKNEVEWDFVIWSDN